MIALGVVMGTHGVRGDLKVKVHNEDSDLLFELDAVQLYAPTLPEVGARWCDLEQVRPGGKGLLIRLSGVDTMEAAQALRGAELRVPRSALPDLEPGEFYHCDLPGLRVQDASGEPVGTLERVVPYPAADVLRVATERGAYEVPMREPYLVEVDVAGGFVVVDQLDDLELEVPRSVKTAETGASEAAVAGESADGTVATAPASAGPERD
jgi:16S rRNA processing protein RimM